MTEQAERQELIQALEELLPLARGYAAARGQRPDLIDLDTLRRAEAVLAKVKGE